MKNFLFFILLIIISNKVLDQHLNRLSVYANALIISHDAKLY
jgi:hypothetical protein